MASIFPSTSGRPTGNALVDTLVWGGSWTPALGRGVTLNWTTTTSGLGAPAEAWTSAEIEALRSALQSWGNIANLNFTSDPGTSPDLVYFKVSGATMDSLTGTTGVLGFHDTPDGSSAAPLQGVFNSDQFVAGNLLPGADGFLTLVHEIGHGLGLAHPHDGGGSGETFPGVGNASDLGTYQLNQDVYTVMSYNVGWAAEPSGSLLWGGAAGPMALDIAAAQAIYGANTSYRAADDSYLLPQANASGTGWNCIWDTAGSDAISNAGSSADCVIDLREAPLTGANAGGYVSWVQGIAGGYTVAHGALVENAIGGAGNDILQGNAAANILDGGAGTDVLAGGDGSDTYRVDNAADVVTETNAAAAGGIDLVQASVSYALGANLELLTLTGSSAIDGGGNSLDNTLTGNAVANRLEGEGGNDTLIGGGGADTLLGGAGNDNYVVDDTLAAIVENAGEGVDTATSRVSYTLGANVENLVLEGGSAINGTGNELANTLVGNAAANVLDGGLGDDTMNGGGGDDTYIVSSAGDSIVEALDGGSDLVQTGQSYALAANLENLSLTGAADISGTGNALANVITGNAGANLLDGAAGADSLRGGNGDDTYRVDLVSSPTALSIEDEVVETAPGGIDTVILRGAPAAGFETNLTMVDNVENYDMAATGTARINLAGNALANTMTGNAGANVLDGGAGADRMYGGDGSDTYVVDDAGDLPTEASATASGGTDTVMSSANYVLGDNIERLSLTGTADINGVGNALNNVITGNQGANVLDGGGGGVDNLSGGKGDDTYFVDVIAAGRSLKIEDRITEAKDSGSDTVVFRTAGSLALDGTVRVAVAANIENYDVSGTGTAAIDLVGNATANTLIGNAGANSLDGGSGADRLSGGDGNDSYLVDNSGDVVSETNAAAAGGIDHVYATLSYSLGANLENLTLTGAAAANGTGNTLDNVLVGNLAANTLDGGAGDDVLDGGAGIDILVGGSGNDTYQIDHKSDSVIELAGEGIDQVLARATHVLSANVENLSLVGRNAINGTGNELDNILLGNGAANVLDGGAGADLMSGGDGSDTYIVDSSGDLVTETNALTAGGIDLVKASIGYVLGDNLENLTLTGTAQINATGNALRNTLTGNDAANILDGGAGADNLAGGLGDDIYFVDLIAAGTRVLAQDAFVEAIDAGIDTVMFRADTPLSLDTALSLLAAVNFENYDVSATADLLVNLKGNTLSNILTGNAAANVLDGGANADVLIGGAGDDTLIGGNGDDFLTGGDGADSFILDALARLSGNTDTIGDFAVGIDTLVIDKGLFTAFKNFTAVDAGHLVVGTSAADADDFLIYNGGTLYYDADGSGAKLAMPIATLIGVPGLSHTDIQLQA